MLEAIDDTLEERVVIHGAARLEGLLTYPGDRTQCTCLLAPPHPFMGGTLDNNVLRQLARVLSAEAGGVCLRFNYRGVGASEGAPVAVLAGMQQFWETGTAPHDPLFLEDCAAARQWLEETAPLPLIGIGYSFGAHSLVTSGLAGLAALILILPTVQYHDFAPLRAAGLPKLILYSDDDFATPRPALDDWLTGVAGPKRAVCIPRGQHFFRGQESLVAGICRDFILEVLEEGGAHA